MPKFIAIVYGAGHGCDYTIGCNLQVFNLSDPVYDFQKMESWDDLKECKKTILQHFGDIGLNGDVKSPRQIDRIKFIEVAKMKEINTSEKLDNLYKKQKKQRKIDKERRQYERLKKKFS